MSQENVSLIRKANEAWNGDPLNPPYEYFDPEVEWETRWPGLPRWFHGHAGLRDWVERALEPIQLRKDLIDARSLDQETVLAEYRIRGQGRASGVGTEMPTFDLDWIRNGLVYRRRTFRTEVFGKTAAHTPNAGPVLYRHRGGEGMAVEEQLHVAAKISLMRSSCSASSRFTIGSENQM